MTDYKPFEMRDMEQVLELLVPIYILFNINIYYIISGFNYIYAYMGILCIMTCLVIWFKFSMNIGIIQPLLIPILIMILEMSSFIFVSIIGLLLNVHIISFLCLSVIFIAILGSLLWKSNTNHNIKDTNDTPNKTE